MIVTRDDKYAAEIRQRIIDNYSAKAAKENEKRDKDKLIHVSDIVFPRKTYYDVTQGRTITDKAIGFWFTGIAYANELQRILGVEKAEVEVIVGHFVAHIDYKDKFVHEFKTSRKWTIPARPAPHYIRQTGYYCAMTDEPVGKIVVIFPTAGRKWKGGQTSTVEIAAWELEFSAAERKLILSDMTQTEEAIIWALDHHDPSRLPPAPEWLLDDFDNADGGKYSEKYEEKHPFNFVDVEVKNE